MMQISKFKNKNVNNNYRQDTAVDNNDGNIVLYYICHKDLKIMINYRFWINDYKQSSVRLKIILVLPLCVLFWFCRYVNISLGRYYNSPIIPNSICFRLRIDLVST